MSKVWARLFAVVGLVAGAMFAVMAPSGAGPTSWSVAPSPSPARPSNNLAAVSCSNPTSCVAVGAGGHTNETFDGTTWSIVAGPAAPDGTLSAVSCVSPTSCMAVGSSTTAKTLTEAWDGTSWHVVPSPTPAGATFVSLGGVSCTSAVDCTAVGSSQVKTAPQKTLIEHWNGTAWRIVASPNPAHAVQAFLNGVTCRAAASCIAVGGHVEAGDNKGGPFAERWNGSSWTILPIATPKARAADALLTTARLNSVSCPTATTCIAVGFTPSDALVERWNGTTWTRVNAPTLPAQDSIAELNSVSCASANDCSAVGVTFLPVDQREGVERDNSIIEHFNGKAWTIQPRAAGVPVTQNSEGAGGLSQLTGVSCAAAASCAAVGNAAVAERWDGARWSLAPLSAPGSSSQLDQVACPSPTSCYAVGAAAAPLELRNNTLVEHWDGSAWSIIPSPTPSGINVEAALVSISCVSDTNCTAVGSYNAVTGAGLNSGFTAALIEQWNGTTWSMLTISAPAPNTRHALLTSVSCASATSCDAVGRYDTFSVSQGGAYHLMDQHWNGTRWSLVAVPGSDFQQLNGVSCVSATNCLAVGQSAQDSTQSERWDGAHWTVVPMPALGTHLLAALNGVSCTAATDCTAVGSIQVGNTPQKPLTEHWNGTAWSVVAAPGPAGASSSTLQAVSCPTAANCTAVGFSINNSLATPAQQLIEQWNGTSWSIVAVAGPPGSVSLNGVTCLSSTACVAVGTIAASNGNFTLVEQSS